MVTVSNYLIWKPMMEDLRHCKDLHNPIEFQGTKPNKTGAKEWKKLSKKAAGTIR